MVCPYFGTLIRFLRASSTAFWIASGTSRALGETVSTAIGSLRVEDWFGLPSELEPPFASAVRDRGDAAVVAVAAAVEDAGPKVGPLGPLRQQLPGAPGLFHRGELA